MKTYNNLHNHRLRPPIGDAEEDVEDGEDVGVEEDGEDVEVVEDVVDAEDGDGEFLSEVGDAVEDAADDIDLIYFNI